jgi:hypothetical protein
MNEHEPSPPIAGHADADRLPSRCNCCFGRVPLDECTIIPIGEAEFHLCRECSPGCSWLRECQRYSPEVVALRRIEDNISDVNHSLHGLNSALLQIVHIFGLVAQGSLMQLRQAAPAIVDKIIAEAKRAAKPRGEG